MFRNTYHINALSRVDTKNLDNLEQKLTWHFNKELCHLSIHNAIYKILWTKYEIEMLKIEVEVWTNWISWKYGISNKILTILKILKCAPSIDC